MTKILLVEDDKSLREIYGVRLLAEGYDIVSAGDGEEALAMAIKERPQLIVSDVMMPKISGFDMLDILRSTTETKTIKVIMMTALSSEDQRARGEALGADRYLVKSQVGIEDVVRTIHEVLGDAPVSGAAQPFASSPAPAAVRPAPEVPARQPAPAATPAPQANVPPAPVQPASQPTAVPPRAPVPPSNAHSAMPQPTAPFSTARPASLGERIIHPIGQQDGKPDISALMDQELSQAQAPAPTSPAAPVAPPPPPAPVAAAPQGPPLPPTPPTPAAPAQPPLPPAPAPQAPPQQPEGSGIEFEETPRPAGSSGPQPAV